MPILRSPSVYFAHPSYGRPIGLGKVFIITSGLSVPSDASSVDAGDLQDVFYNDSEGSQIEVSQPLNTTKGGLLYSDDPVIIRQYYTDASSYIVAVYDASGALVYADTMAGTFGGSGGGSAGAATIVTDWDNAITADFYQDAGPGSLNQPVPGRRFVGWVSNVNESGDSLTQYAVDVSVANGAAYLRTFSLGIPGTWRNIWDSSSFTKQSGPLDGTTGAAMLVGAAGWLSTAVEWTNSVNDINLSSLYKLSLTATDTPAGAAVEGSAIIHVKIDSITAHQIFIEAGTGATWTRSKAGTFGGWSVAGRTGLSNKDESYELVSTDFGSTVRFSGGAAMTATLTAGRAYDGALVQVINRNTGDLSIVPASCTLTWISGGAALTGARTLISNSACTILRVNADNYEIYGFGLA